MPLTKKKKPSELLDRNVRWRCSDRNLHP